MVAPTNAPPDDELDSTPPDDELQLEWVYGFRGFDTRRAALWASDKGGSPLLVYPAAAVVVVYNPATHTQSFFREHKDDVLGIAVHRPRGLVASAQKSYRERGRARKPTIWIWQVAEDGTVETLKGPLVFTACNQVGSPPLPLLCLIRSPLSSRRHRDLR